MLIFAAVVLPHAYAHVECRHVLCRECFTAWQALRAEVAELRGMAASAEADLRSAQEVGGGGSAPAPGELEELRDMAQAEAAELLARVRSPPQCMVRVPFSRTYMKQAAVGSTQ